MKDIGNILKGFVKYQLYSVLMILALVPLTGCSGDAAIIENSKLNRSKDVSVSGVDSFQHPIFAGISQICLPFIDTRSSDESLIIKNLAKVAGFKEGYLRDYSIEWGPHPPVFVYSTGNKDYGSEIEAVSNIDKKSCSSTVVNITEKYPSVTEFTQWLKKENPGWEVIYDIGLFVREEEKSNYEYVFYCNKQNGEYEQGLAYSGQELTRTGPKGIKVNNISILVEDVGKQKCSGFLKKYTRLIPD